ncbi:hypothetical protein RXV86_13565 [Alisedimentitalea sp. MJ-SS2]|uniref:hypothetical protein n=1 Tax=Aliisedimentitalea sp. MJ-SS2 TaxID=3049795 RepID=UPI00290F4820|nr:hypothetical protein [Alisedimentitalea sp. MJ-SS2]MDU8928413.1 hypothetical protein [Alisedimentitalea sp. MJ-SS2]
MNDKIGQGVLHPDQIVNAVGVNTGDLVTSVVATAIVAAATSEISRAREVWGFQYYHLYLRIPLE